MKNSFLTHTKAGTHLILAIAVAMAGRSPAHAATVSSANGAAIAPLTKIVDSSGNTWTVKTGNAYKNGAKAGVTADIATLLYLGGVIYQINSKSPPQTFQWNGSTWPAATDPRIVSKSGTDVTGAGYLVDGGKHVWAISGGSVYKDGVATGTTSKATDLIYVGGKVYYKNSLGKYFVWNGTSWPSSPSPISTPTPSPSPTPSSTGTTGSSGIPAPAVAAGYKTLSFNSIQIAPFATNSTYDFPKTGGWYYSNYWGQVPVEDEAVTAGGTLTLNGGVNQDGYGSQVSTVVYDKNQPTSTPWKGKAFGGGYYFETVAKLTGNAIVKDEICIWTVAVESNFGQAPNEQWIEMDGPEFDYDNDPITALLHVGVSLHNWYETSTGVRKRTDPASLISAATFSKPVNMNEFHTFGNLWVPVSAENPKGRMEWYIDNEATPYASTTWTKYLGTSLKDGPIPPSANPGAAIDVTHQVPVLNTKNPDSALVVQSVRIWQAEDGANNLTR